MTNTMELLKRMGFRWLISSDSFFYYDNFIDPSSGKFTNDELMFFLKYTGIIVNKYHIEAIPSLRKEDEEKLFAYLRCLKIGWDDTKNKFVAAANKFTLKPIVDFELMKSSIENDILDSLEPEWALVSPFLSDKEKIDKQVSILLGVLDKHLEINDFTERFLDGIKKDIKNNPEKFRKDIIKSRHYENLNVHI